MTVRELIRILEHFDKDLPVWVSSDGHNVEHSAVLWSG